VTAGLIAWLLAHTDRQALWSLLSRVQLGWLLAAAGLIPLQVLLCATRWRRMAEDLGLAMSWTTAVREYGLSMFLNQVLPGGMTGDAVRVWRHRRGHGAVGRPLRAAVAERATGQIAHLLLTLVGLLLWSSVHGAAAPPGSLPLVIGLLVVFGLALAMPDRIRVLGPAARDARTALGSPGRLAFHGTISAALLGTFLLGFTACAAALGHDLGWAVLTAIPLVMLVMVVPFSVAGWGLREASAAMVLGMLGWSTEAALALSAVYGLSVLLGALPGALVLLTRAPGDTSA
jgi:uncharacterized membrane protein YbhN (UPF0104 family)